MTAEEFAKLLKELKACSAARTWAKGKDLNEVWETCPRGDWMLWLAERMMNVKGWPTPMQVVLATCACAETALEHTTDPRPARCIEVVRLWSCGNATLEEVNKACRDYRAASADSAAYAAAYAAIAAYAASYDAIAASASAYAAYDARAKSDKLTADIVRAMLTPPIGTKGLQ